MHTSAKFKGPAQITRKYAYTSIKKFTDKIQVVAENRCMHSWGDNKFIDFLVSWVGTRPSLGMQLICWWEQG